MQIAILCGLPIYNLGENEHVTLWELDNNSKSIFLEQIIINNLRSILNDPDKPNINMSQYIWLIQSLLVELINIGKEIYPDFNTNLSTFLTENNTDTKKFIGLVTNSLFNNPLKCIAPTSITETLNNCGI